ncbi:MAG: hypothetical protein IT324_19320 [Anaerolineae bacterium]|nr:hypothetical protein [Anaerolineae bacterium]
MGKNIRFNYLYRDAGNYKSYGSVVFKNPNSLSLAKIGARLRKAFFQGELFIAEQIGIADIFLYLDDELTVEDHCFHEFVSVEETTEAPTDPRGRSITTFVKKVEHEAQQGWHAYDPFDLRS